MTNGTGTTALRSVRQTAQRAARNDGLEWLTRVGFIGYGLLHLAVAWLAAQLALGHPAGSSDQSGALQTLARQPFGKLLLIVIIVGLVAMAVWQLLLAGVGHRQERGHRRTFERVASLARTVIYAALAWTAGRVVAGAPTSNAAQQQSATAGFLTDPTGRVLVAVAGLVVLAVGIGMIWYGAKRKFEKRLHISRMSRRTRRVAGALGQAGYVSRGVAFGIVGVLVTQASLTNDAAKSRGLDAALRTLAHQPLGTFLLLAVAVGFAAFGAYCFLQFRYRRV